MTARAVVASGTSTLSPRGAELELFRQVGTELIARLTDWLAELPTREVAPRQCALELERLLAAAELPVAAADPSRAFEQALELLKTRAVSTSHPRFFAYIMGSVSPVAALADLLVSAIAVPVTGYATCPVSAAIEAQTVRWLGEMLGYPAATGLFLSGGSVANLVAVRAAIHARAGWDTRADGLTVSGGSSLRVYASREAHSSVLDALVLCGLGARALRIVPVDDLGRMHVDALEALVAEDREAGLRPILVVGTAGTTSTGSIDPIGELARVAAREGLWFHLDAAYGGLAVLAHDAPRDLSAMCHADSLAVDPHKWMYVGANVGCLMSRHRAVLFEAFHQPAGYYAQASEAEPLGGPEVLQFRDLGPETTRSFRALKVRLCLEIFGVAGYAQAIQRDLEHAQRLAAAIRQQDDLELGVCGLSIVTFRYRPAALPHDMAQREAYLSALNGQLLRNVRERDIAFPSHVTVGGRYWLRVCFVNSNTEHAHFSRLAEQVVALGRELHESRRGKISN